MKPFERRPRFLELCWSACSVSIRVDRSFRTKGGTLRADQLVDVEMNADARTEGDLTLKPVLPELGAIMNEKLMLSRWRRAIARQASS